MSTRRQTGTAPVRRPLLILAQGRPRGSRVRARLIAEAERRSIVVAALKAGDGLRSVDLIVEATQADAVIVCAEPPVQAVVAAVAAARDIPCSWMPTGPDDLLARDLGVPLDDPADALKQPFSAAEQTIDIAEVNGVPFVNYVAIGMQMPVRPARRSRGARRRDGEQAGPRHDGGHPALLLCNNRFELLDERLGERDWPDSGRLQIVRFAADADERSYAALRAQGFEERSAVRFQLSLRMPVDADVDGEPRRLEPPLRFRSVHGAVRVHAPGAAGRAPREPVERAERRAELESLGTG